MSDEAVKVLAARRPKVVLSPESALSTGSTLLNLACTDDPTAGFLKGGYYFLVGDSASGKTWFSMTCFAEACINPNFKKHRLIFDDVEGGALMDIEGYFGKEVARRLEPPSKTKSGKPVFSDTIESFYYHIHDVIDKGEPFIYVLDSQDALGSTAAAKKFDKQRAASEEGKDAAGSYGDGKAKYHSENLRTILSGIKRTGSILIAIGQTRDNLGMGFNPKTRSGGNAMTFYANLEIWTSIKGQILRTVNGKERQLGVKAGVHVKKNRVVGKSGKDRLVIVPFLHGYGIDDMGSCVGYLIDEQHWLPVEGEGTEKKPIYRAPELKCKGSPEGIVKFIEQKGLESVVRDVTGKVWREIEAKCAPQRKPRYT